MMESCLVIMALTTMVAGWVTGVPWLEKSALWSVLQWKVLSVKMVKCPVTMEWMIMDAGWVTGVPWLGKSVLQFQFLNFLVPLVNLSPKQ